MYKPSQAPAVIPLFVAALVLLATGTVISASYTTPRLLNTGDTYELTRDGWSDPAGGGAYQGDVIPKVDVNDGANGDNPYFRRHNVARAWSSGTGYWYTVADQFEGEPDPAGEQWVHYAPPFQVLGPGRYLVEASYRGAAARASYPAAYQVNHALGVDETLRDQRSGQNIVWFTLGEFEMRPGSFVRVVDQGSESITFGNMRFKLVRGHPALRLEIVNGEYRLRWPASAVDFRLESTGGGDAGATWEPVHDAPEIIEDEFVLTLTPAEGSRFFRLALP